MVAIAEMLRFLRESQPRPRAGYVESYYATHSWLWSRAEIQISTALVSQPGSGYGYSQVGSATIARGVLRGISSHPQKQNYFPLATHKNKTISFGHSQKQNYFPLANGFFNPSNPLTWRPEADIAGGPGGAELDMVDGHVILWMENTLPLKMLGANGK